MFSDHMPKVKFFILAELAYIPWDQKFVYIWFILEIALCAIPVQNSKGIWLQWWLPLLPLEVGKDILYLDFCMKFYYLFMKNISM